MGKFTFWGHTKHFQSTCTLYMSQARDANYSDWMKSVSQKTAGEQLAHTRCSDFYKLVYTIQHIIPADTT